MKRSIRGSRDQRLIAVFGVLGLLLTGAYVLYLVVTFPHRDLRVTTLFDRLCPFSFLAVVFVDTPNATLKDYVTVWTLAAVLDAALYGVVAAILIKFGRVVRRGKAI